MKKVAEEEKAEIKNFDKEGTVYMGGGHSIINRLYLAKPLFERLHNQSFKAKTHSGCIYTGAVKNVFGCIQGLRKAEYHKAAPNPEVFGNILVDIHEAAKIGLHIMDGITAMKGEGPTAGSIYSANKILISTDPLALDTTAIKMIGLDIKDIPILQAAIERKLGESNKDKIEICGDYVEPPHLQNFKIPKRFTSKKKSNYDAVIKVIDFLKTKPKINLKNAKGVIHV